MRVTVSVMIAGLITVGCTSTIPVHVDEPMNNDRVFNYDQVNTRLDGDSATVTVVKGLAYHGNDIHVTKDSTIFTETQSGIRHVVATRDVLKISCKDYGAGVLSGGLLGSLAGLVTGVGILTIRNDHSPDSQLGAVVIVLGSIVDGTFIGSGIGSLAGSTIEYQFTGSEHRRRPLPYTAKVGAPSQVTRALGA